MTESHSEHSHNHPASNGNGTAPEAGFVKPRKRILLSEHVAAFQQSPTHATILDHITAMNEAVVGVKLTDEVEIPPGVHALLEVLDRVDDIAKDTPPANNEKSRFGNPAFRTFMDRVVAEAPALHEKIPGLPKEAIVEVSGYFLECWGNKQRIDYGSGMELNFLCWLICLEKLSVVTPSDYRALVIRVFWRYVSIMRRLQSTYWLEPAGSHGVWGLDDYHFLPFLWGAGQLRDHKYLKPKSIHDAELVEEMEKDYMYLACIRFINSIKTASLRWHSPMLDDISSVKTWAKVNEGMIKMYRAEVLAKLPIIQHFLFGSLLQCPDSIPPPDEHELEHDGHDAHWGHAHSLQEAGKVDRDKFGWGDCCGIPVPSAFGQAQAEKEGGGKLKGFPVTGAIRRVPFD